MLKFSENVLSTTILNKKLMINVIGYNECFQHSSLKKQYLQYDIGSCCCCTCCCCIGVNIGSGSVSTNFNQPNTE
ncbi:hypothetical protein [Clostridium tarantellae]|uniref:Bacteriocin n=1 Tax=Clostridium tarantellae TaxID=39493 RepID=A0A6I1MPK0_9CLOT|nr:hypothetical protein [Clostridium tarantellae]MPQ44994.1 hypothetical protein [Clostridium tarantellae]